MEKPQGFEVAKLAKRGIFACIYDCGEYFDTKGKAKRHRNCPNKMQCDEYIKELKRDCLIEEKRAFKKFLILLGDVDFRAKIDKFLESLVFEE